MFPNLIKCNVFAIEILPTVIPVRQSSPRRSRDWYAELLCDFEQFNQEKLDLVQLPVHNFVVGYKGLYDYLQVLDLPNYLGHPLIDFQPLTNFGALYSSGGSFLTNLKNLLRVVCPKARDQNSKRN
ncbi:MAG TPA: hypothetical protein VKK79_10265 [Candidatus Lokiarchaeia archaeon]|nr:hypothetical protein [Candidatus Lokiarchaeia archaeon]